MTFGAGRHTTFIFIYSFFKERMHCYNTTIFSIIGIKNNQSDADREISILWSTDNAGNSVTLVSCIFRLPSGLDYSVCIETDN